MSDAIRTSLVAAAVASQRWMLYQPHMQAMVDVINNHRMGVKIAAADLEAIMSHRDTRARMMADEFDGLGTVTGVRGVEGREQYVRVDGGSEGGKIGAGGVIVPVHGILCKRADSINGLSQPRGMTWDQAADAIAAGHTDRQSKWTIVDIYSPGGSVDGAEDFLTRVRQVRGADKSKPLVAMIHDLGASGGYFAACCCDEIYATRNAIVGSIASYSMMEDSSKMYEKMGITRYVVGGGEHKGVGEEGVEITAAQLKEKKRNAMSTTAWFTQRALVEGRGMEMEAAAAISDGRVWIGEEARELGLTDGTCSLMELVAQLRKAAA